MTIAGVGLVPPTDILILSNGPGEVTTWLRPVVKALRQLLGDDRSLVRISVVLSPCPNATGEEVAIALSYPEVDRVQAAEHFFPFLLQGKTAENWDWRDNGVVVFLGGDQFFCVVIGKRLGYRTVIYAEWDARWHAWIDRFGVMKPEMIKKVSKYADKFTVVGDLMADVAEGKNEGTNSVLTQHSAKAECKKEGTNSTLHPQDSPTRTQLIGLLPGSKPAKLTQGVPLALKIAEYIHEQCPQTRFVIPVAPTLTLSTLARFADPLQNLLIKRWGWADAALVTPAAETGELPFLKTSTGLRVDLWTKFPAHDLLSQCALCVTTVGANTAELGSLAVPMFVLLPTQQLDAMRSWDGLPGLLARLPGIGSGAAKLINWLVLRQGRLFAWPNIWAQSEIVPEFVGRLEPEIIAAQIIDFINHPEKLEEMRSRLRAVRGQPGAAQKLAQLVQEVLDFD
ncbi:MAG: lipid-A-disaccharide synthase [Kastovskya adunca ATA6-11-RM4]|jgi:lipid-A-disaccharide synthase|nr:lipid-A-disaccharide synthase [Kastovskya adunca ATA6-11-RM4]